MIKRLIILLALSSQALGVTTILNSFNAGELSPYLEGRTDLEKYYSGCRTLENFLVLSYGGAQRRPGSVYIGPVKNSAQATRLISFEYSTTQAYIIEMGNQYMRFYKDGGRIQNGLAPVQIATSYVTADLWEIQFIQSADTMYLVHPDYAPAVLTRSSHTAWTLTDIDFERGPFKDDNITDTTITPTAITGSITLTASDPIWNANHVGALWKVTHTVDSNEASKAFTTGAAQNSTKNTVHLGQRFDFSTHGTWTGTVILQRSYDDGSTWKDVRPVHYEDDGNITYTDTEPVDDAIYRMHKDASGISSGTCNANFIVRSFDVEGVVEITAYSDPCNVDGDVQYDLGSTDATDVWAEGAFSADEGFPATLAFYQERLCFGGTTNQPQTIWMSVTDDWTNFLAGTNDDSALTWTIASDQVNVIRWMAPQSALLIGTTGAEWRLSASDSDKPVTPTNVEVRRQSSYGSAAIQPAMLNNTVLYAQRQAKKIRELIFSFTEDAWVSPDLTVLAEHITGTGITEMALQKTPDPILWCVRSDGELAALTYQKDHDVVGWSRHTLSGDVESVAVIPGDGEDEVWCTVKRTIDGQTKRYIEQFGGREWASQEDAIYADSCLSWDGGAAIAVENITATDPAVVTAQDHGLSTGDHIRLESVGGMTSLNGKVFYVTYIDRDNFSLQDKTGNVDWNMTGITELVANDANFAGYVFGNTTVGACGSQGIGQTFTLTADYSVITSIQVLSDYTSGASGTLPFTCELRSGGINGSVASTASLVYIGGFTYRSQDGPPGAAPLAWETITFPTAAPLAAGTHAFIYYRNSTQSCGAYGMWSSAYNSAGNPYSGGKMYTAFVSGTTTSLYTAVPATNDLAFRINGYTGTSNSAETYTSGGWIFVVNNSFSGLGHLEGETVAISGDGGSVPGSGTMDEDDAVTGDYSVSSGTVTIGTDDEDYYNTVHIGLPFTAYLKTERLEVPSAGTVQGENKRVTEVTVRLVESLGGKIGYSFADADMEQMIFRDADDTLEAMTPLYSGDRKLSYQGGYDTDYSFFLKHDQPLPFTVTAIIPKFEVYK